MKENQLTVKTIDGKDWHIYVLDVFKVDAFPEKEYIAYTFGEYENGDDVRSYISVLNDGEKFFCLEQFDDEEEENIVRTAYQNKVLESGEA